MKSTRSFAVAFLRLFLRCALSVFSACDPMPQLRDGEAGDATTGDRVQIDVPRRRDVANAGDLPDVPTDVLSDVPGRRYPPDTIVVPMNCDRGGLNGRITRITVGADGCPSFVEAIGFPRQCDCTPVTACCEIDPSCEFPVELGWGSYQALCEGIPDGPPHWPNQVHVMARCLDGVLSPAPGFIGPIVQPCIDCVQCFPGHDR